MPSDKQLERPIVRFPPPEATLPGYSVKTKTTEAISSSVNSNDEFLLHLESSTDHDQDKTSLPKNFAKTNTQSKITDKDNKSNKQQGLFDIAFVEDTVWKGKHSFHAAPKDTAVLDAKLASGGFKYARDKQDELAYMPNPDHQIREPGKDFVLRKAKTVLKIVRPEDKETTCKPQ